MTITTNSKTPVADVLGGDRDEGLNSPTTKKESTTMVSAAVPTRIQLDDQMIIDVEPVLENVEITISSRDVFGEARTTYGIALTPEETRKLTSALLDASAPAFGSSPITEIEEHVEIARKVPVEIPVSELAAGTVTDLLRFAQDHDMRPSEVMPAVETFIDAMAEAESLTPAKWCKRWRQIHKEARA